MSNIPQAKYEEIIRAERRIVVPETIRLRLGIALGDHLNLRISDFSYEQSIVDRFKVISNYRVTLEKKSHCVMLGVEMGDYVQIEILSVESGEQDAEISQSVPEVN